MTAECDFSGLPAGQCSHCTGASLTTKPTRWEGTDTEARFPGSCACCGQCFTEGARIVCADVQGNGSDEWCIYSHTIGPHG